jgi:hypothetical protein
MRKTAIVVLGLLLGMVGLTGVASAHPSNSGVFGTSFVDGGDAVTDDWGDNFAELGNSICNGCADSFNTDLVMMWQSILVAEGFLAANQVDGQFGPITAGATRSWQTRYSIGIDGQVGNQTWSRADEHLLWFSTLGSLLVYRSPVTGGEVGFFRGNENVAFDGGAYELVDLIAANGQFYTFANTRIQYFSKTTTGPTQVALAPGQKAPGR